MTGWHLQARIAIEADLPTAELAEPASDDSKLTATESSTAELAEAAESAAAKLTAEAATTELSTKAAKSAATELSTESADSTAAELAAETADPAELAANATDSTHTANSTDTTDAANSPCSANPSELPTAEGAELTGAKRRQCDKSRRCGPVPDDEVRNRAGSTERQIPVQARHLRRGGRVDHQRNRADAEPGSHFGEERSDTIHGATFWGLYASSRRAGRTCQRGGRKSARKTFS